MTDSQTWWEATFEIAEHSSEEMGVLLIESGALGVQTISDEIPLPRLPDIHGNPPEALELNIAPGHHVLIACFASDQTEASILAIVENCHNGLDAVNAQPVEVKHCDDTSWQTMWKAFFTPRQIGENFWVIPSWEQDFKAPQDAYPIIIDPGMAFGTGHHGTTALCLAALEQVLQVQTTPSLLDVGCGSGILSIAASLLGAQEINAIDIDPKAVEVTLENAELNQVEGIRASTDAIERISATYDVVIANILANILLRLAPGIVGTVSPESTLILSGIPLHQIDEVKTVFGEAYSKRWGQTLPQPSLTEAGEWACLVYQPA
ncbi:MAG: 50S ribosomal protein L11 methyltransferase [Deltaproteobacteria bacterium]|jgi:ribosomal protein L11 methyltransferase|nr:50S ribosomal protein L11 methyltransferase [Deltaproteobacteria bacterium]MBT6431536.1 50S ribosomal protein L11 methyltransferase [Deltaproteobacteria bacterium]MBT6491472.1 50S ribosomal protein L11 methyltransferase [Deltaproteobacteria bacterium]